MAKFNKERLFNAACRRAAHLARGCKRRLQKLLGIADPPLPLPPPPFLPFNDLLNGAFGFTYHVWAFGRVGGETLAPRLRFLPDGRILGANQPNEAAWRIEDGARLLIISNTGIVTTIFDQIEWSGGVPTLTGAYQFGAVIHTLSPAGNDMHVELTQRHCGESLLVIPTSRGRPFDGQDTNWELWELPRRSGFDHLRIAEHRKAIFWYVNKTRRIMRYLRFLVEQGYRSFCFFGMSSGGYAALLLAELLSDEFPHLKIRTIVINPQTILGEEVQKDFARRGIPKRCWPDMVEDDEVAQHDVAPYNIAEVIAGHPPRRGDIMHHVYFDALNPCEAHFALALRGLPGVELHPKLLGVGHAEGIGRIYHDNLAEIESEIFTALAQRGAPCAALRTK